MRTLTIDDINQLEHGEIIPHFEGRITKVFPQKTGEGQYGPWHLQTMMVGEGQNEISITWTGEDTFNDWEGVLASFECTENNKGKLVGVLRDVRVDKEGKTWKGVKVTPAAKIKRLNGDSKSEEIKAKGERFREELENQQKSPPPDKIPTYAAHAGRIFAAAWEESKNAMALIPAKDGEEMSAYEWNDLRVRIAQGITIEVEKIIRKERF